MDEVSSVEQDNWCETVVNLRKGLLRHMQYMDAMNPGEMSTYINTLQGLMKFEMEAKEYDVKHEWVKKIYSKIFD